MHAVLTGHPIANLVFTAQPNLDAVLGACSDLTPGSLRRTTAMSACCCKWSISHVACLASELEPYFKKNHSVVDLSSIIHPSEMYSIRKACDGKNNIRFCNRGSLWWKGIHRSKLNCHLLLTVILVATLTIHATILKFDSSLLSKAVLKQYCMNDKTPYFLVYQLLNCFCWRKMCNWKHSIFKSFLRSPCLHLSFDVSSSKQSNFLFSFFQSLLGFPDKYCLSSTEMILLCFSAKSPELHNWHFHKYHNTCNCVTSDGY